MSTAFAVLEQRYETRTNLIVNSLGTDKHFAACSVPNDVYEERKEQVLEELKQLICNSINTKKK